MVGRHSCIFFIYFIICSNFHKYFNFKIHLHYWNKVPYATFTYFATRGNPFLADSNLVQSKTSAYLSFD